MCIEYSKYDWFKSNGVLLIYYFRWLFIFRIFQKIPKSDFVPKCCIPRRIKNNITYNTDYIRVRCVYRTRNSFYLICILMCMCVPCCAWRACGFYVFEKHFRSLLRTKKNMYSKSFIHTVHCTVYTNRYLEIEIVSYVYYIILYIHFREANFFFHPKVL